MQLNITTDYAIRIILALANRDGEVVSSKDISITMKIPQKYVLKITPWISQKCVRSQKKLV